MFNYESLLSEIRRVMSDADYVTLDEEQQDDTEKAIEKAKQSLEDMLGAMAIDIKKWGTRPEKAEDASQERKIVAEYIKSLQTDGTPDGILRSLENSFQNLEEGQVCDPVEAGNCNLGVLLSQIQLLNTMSRVLTNFGASEAGFIMEALLSAMFPGGQVVPVGTGTIADFQVKAEKGETGYSLKTISEKKSVDGSIVELVKSLQSGPMTYYIFAKKKASKSATDMITVYRFTIDLNNVADWIKLDNDQIREIMLAETGPELKELKGKYGRFRINKTEYQPKSDQVAVLVLDPRKLLKKAECELASVKDQLISIQKAFKGLVFSMNKYFASMSNSAAIAARNSSDAFGKIVAANVQGDATCEK
tara:strand:- start:700 stop:1785 length:1086 start_codon:yes stop_codon:yes gene_type:complete